MLKVAFCLTEPEHEVIYRALGYRAVPWWEQLANSSDLTKMPSSHWLINSVPKFGIRQISNNLAHKGQNHKGDTKIY